MHGRLDFKDVYAFLESVEPPGSIHSRSTRGRQKRALLVFNDHCADCHGTYGSGGSYPNSVVPLDELGTDGVRFEALKKSDRESYHRSWFAHLGEHHTRVKPKGYIAPPLDGVWASAPYFHNGSVPTLWHVLNPNARPHVCGSERRTDTTRHASGWK